MYIQITTICNMSCDHCGMSCTHEGENMSIETWEATINLIKNLGEESIALGGGEPTLHPDFWRFIGESLGAVEFLWLATNGSMTDISLSLANLAKRGIIGCELSIDEYHDPIDESVIKAFTKKKTNIPDRWKNDEDMRNIRTVTGSEILSGRCDWGTDGCICPDLIIKPNGDIMACGCDDAPKLGSVFSDFEVPEDWENGECYKNQPISEV